MKNKTFLMIFCSFLIIGAGLASHISAQTWYGYCFTGVNSSNTCNNTGSTGTSNELANFTHKLADTNNVPNAYQINLTRTVWTPTIVRGTPVYQNYLINDNKNGKYYTYNNHNGKYLNDQPFLSINTGRTTGYSPSSGEAPTTNLFIKTADGFDCYSKPLSCITYTQANQFNVNSN